MPRYVEWISALLSAANARPVLRYLFTFAVLWIGFSVGFHYIASNGRPGDPWFGSMPWESAVALAGGMALFGTAVAEWIARHR
jgi:hypothetical protein